MNYYIAVQDDWIQMYVFYYILMKPFEKTNHIEGYNNVRLLIITMMVQTNIIILLS